MVTHKQKKVQINGMIKLLSSSASINYFPSSSFNNFLRPPFPISPLSLLNLFFLDVYIRISFDVYIRFDSGGVLLSCMHAQEDE